MAQRFAAVILLFFCLTLCSLPYAFWNVSGGMAEWSMAAVLKTVSPKGDVGSNPTPSARKFAEANFSFDLLLLTCNIRIMNFLNLRIPLVSFFQLVV